WLAFGPDGSLWVSEYSNNEILRMSQDGQVLARYTTPFAPADMAVAPDGTVWFDDVYAIPSAYPVGFTRMLGRITPDVPPDRAVTAFSYPDPNAGAGGQIGGFRGVTIGPDGNIWVCEGDVGRVAKISPAGVLLAEYASPTPGANPYTMGVGPDGNLWFTD